jgi:hypothetical protein
MVSYNCALAMTLPSWLSLLPSPHRACGPGNVSLRGLVACAPFHHIGRPDVPQVTGQSGASTPEQGTTEMSDGLVPP